LCLQPIGAPFFESIVRLEDVELRFAPDDAAEEITPFLKSSHWTLKPQGEGDLGEDVACDGRGFEDSDAVLIFGTDCPYIDSFDLGAALEAIQSSDVVLGPAKDGGYWTIGLSQPQSALFEGISWSTDQVLEQTLERAKQRALNCRLLRELEDVDDSESWERYQLTGSKAGNP
jgi:rSAM/selenodomain-associated transferase 1